MANLIGSRIERKEDKKFLTGKGRYTADINLVNQTYAYFVRSPHARAKIIKVAADKVLTKLTLAGAVYITFVCLLPEFLIVKFNVPFYFGGTSLLIIVVVVMDFMSQIQAHLMSHQYEGLMKKANLKGHGKR